MNAVESKAAKKTPTAERMVEEDEENQEASLADDERVQYIAERVVCSLRLRADKWLQFIRRAENQTVLAEFLHRERLLVCFLSGAGLLAASCGLPSNLKNKAVYIFKKVKCPILKENYRKNLVFGHLAGTPLNQITTLVEEIFVPVLSSKRNHRAWPHFISQDVDRHVEAIRNKIYIVNGQAMGRTLLPIPKATGKLGGSNRNGNGNK